MMGKDFNSKHWREIMIENTSKKKKRKNNSFDIVGAKNWDGAKLSSAHNDYIKLDRIYKTMDFDTDIPSSITVTPDITSDIECVKYQSDYERICGDVIKKFGFSFIYSGRKIVFNFGRKIRPDFIDVNKGLAIEVGSEYYHEKNSYEEERRRIMEASDFRVLFLWDNDKKAGELDIVTKISNFVGES